MTSTKTDRDLIRSIDGFYVGSLDDEQIESFHRCVADGFAYRSYEGAGGFMGLAKVRFISTEAKAEVFNSPFVKRQSD